MKQLIYFKIIWYLVFFSSQNAIAANWADHEDLFKATDGVISGRDFQKQDPNENNERQHLRDGRVSLSRKSFKQNTVLRQTNDLTRSENGNLPSYARRSDVNVVVAAGNHIQLTKIDKISDDRLGIGDMVDARVDQTIVAYEGGVTPVRAIITDGILKGAITFGGAKLDNKTKNIVLEFSSIRLNNNKKSQKYLAQAFSEANEYGVKGEIETDYWKYFLAKALSESVKGIADATTDRTQNVWGNYQVVPSVDGAAKQGLVKASESVTSDLAEKLHNVPEYARIEGPVFVKLIIVKEPEI